MAIYDFKRNVKQCREKLKKILNVTTEKLRTITLKVVLVEWCWRCFDEMDKIYAHRSAN